MGPVAPTIDSIDELLAQGKVPQARKAIAALPKQHPQRAALLRRVDDLDLRKAQRQAKVKDFVRLAGPEHQLALARLQGPQALDALATSDHPDAPRSAVAAAADAAALRKALRRLPGPPELGLGFAALVAGDLQRAKEAFAVAAATDARRAQLGLALCAARGNAPQEALAALEGITALPGSAFPATAKLRKLLQKQHKHSFNGASLRELLIKGSAADLQQALESRPKQDRQARGWLALRLGDRHWAQSCDEEGRFTQPDLFDQVIENWEQAASLNPALLADVSKRLLHLAGDTPHAMVRACKCWWRLYQQEPQLASQIMDTLCHNLPTEIAGFLLLELARQEPKSRRAALPPCLLLLRIRLHDEEARCLGEQLDAETWKEDCAILDQAYGEQALWLDLKLSILQYRGNMAELRKCCVTVLRQQPQRISDLLPMYVLAANKDRRAHKQIAREVPELLRLAPQDPHLILLACERDIPHDPLPDQQVGQLIQALAQRDGPRLSPWAQQPWGQHATVDLLRTTLSRRFTPEQRRPWLTKDALAIIHPRICALADIHLGGCMPFMRQWHDAKPQDWRPIYHLLRALRSGWDDKQYPKESNLISLARVILHRKSESAQQDDPHWQRLAAWVDELDLPYDFGSPYEIDDLAPTPAQAAPKPATKPGPSSRPLSAENWREWVKDLATQPHIQGLFTDLQHGVDSFRFLHAHFLTIMDQRDVSPLSISADRALSEPGLVILKAFRDRFHRWCDLGQLSALELTIVHWQRELLGGHAP